MNTIGFVLIVGLSLLLSIFFPGFTMEAIAISAIGLALVLSSP